MDMNRKQDLLASLRSQVRALEIPLLTGDKNKVMQIEHLLEHNLEELSELTDRMEDQR